MGDMPTTDGHGWARKRGVITSYACGEKSKLSKLWVRRIQKSTVRCSSVRFGGQNITARLAMLALCGLRPRIERNDCDFVEFRGHLVEIGLQKRNSLCSFGLPPFLLFPQSHELCGSPDSYVRSAHSPSSKVQSHNAAYVPERSHCF